MVTTRFDQKSGLRWAVTDSTIALTLALFVNAVILIPAAALFHTAGRTDVVDIEQPIICCPHAGHRHCLHAVRHVLASGVNSTVTATLGGQIVMEGFLQMRVPAWARRLIIRAIAIIPVVIVTALYGERGTSQLLVWR
jgi:manganese transport protein